MSKEKSLPRNKGKPDYDISKTEEIILIALSGKELYGLQIPQAMQESSGGQRTLGIGSLYPTLRRLEKQGLLEARWGDERPSQRSGARRRYYRLSARGASILENIQCFRESLLVWQPS